MTEIFSSSSSNFLPTISTNTLSPTESVSRSTSDGSPSACLVMMLSTTATNVPSGCWMPLCVSTPNRFRFTTRAGSTDPTGGLQTLAKYCTSYRTSPLSDTASTRPDTIRCTAIVPGSTYPCLLHTPSYLMRSCCCTTSR